MREAEELQSAKSIITQAWERLMEERGGFPMLGRILATIQLSPEPLTQKQISDKTNYSLAAVSQALKTLLQFNAIRRHKKPGERTTYYSSQSSFSQMIIAGLLKWIETSKQLQESIKQAQKMVQHFNPRNNEEIREKQYLAKLLTDMENTLNLLLQIFQKTTDELKRYAT
ncbi:MAG: winged helix-turn-helix transcriptional regulator [Candidatus Jordarchaeaceae archaeon]|nr:winged helix-turn-helix transcriptional regulator [Candidatus Jordarchaeia archaeon]MBS7268867.1 winged helix-turn-helix transcriptional regulator [Candidatus Jordarchaeia archaeon]